jgi:hypothetical protein
VVSVKDLIRLVKELPKDGFLEAYESLGQTFPRTAATPSWTYYKVSPLDLC